MPDELRDLGGLEPMVGGRPRGQIAPGLLGHRQPAHRVRRQGDVVQRDGHLAGEQGKVLFAARYRETLRAHGGGVGVGARPVDQRLVNRQHLDVRFGDRVPHRHRQDDPVAEPRELPVAHQSAAIIEENAKQQRARCLRAQRARHQGNGNQEGENQPLWKSCGRSVHVLWTA